jgi:hypothetical protein
MIGLGIQGLEGDVDPASSSFRAVSESAIASATT